MEGGIPDGMEEAKAKAAASEAAAAAAAAEDEAIESQMLHERHAVTPDGVCWQ